MHVWVVERKYEGFGGWQGPGGYFSTRAAARKEAGYVRNTLSSMGVLTRVRKLVAQSWPASRATETKPRKR